MTEKDPRRPLRMCVHCNALTDEPVVVSEVHAASAPGFNVYACPTCAPHIPKPPDVLELLATGWHGRPDDE